jgi:hypothetical protein
MRPTLTLLLPLLAACSWSRFDDLGESAPVLEVTQTGELHSASFGDAFLGLARTRDEPGGMLVVAGNGEASLTTAVITATGAATVSGADRETMQQDLGNPPRVEALAPAPTASDATAPSLFVSGGGTVRVVNSISYRPVFDPAPVIQHNSSWGPSPTDLGLSLAVADLGSGQDLVAGALDALVLMRFAKGSSFTVEQGRVLAGSEWVRGACRALAAGTLGESPVVRVVAGLPRENRVVLVLDAAACLADTAAPCPLLDLPPPDGAREFGSAVLIADFDPLSNGAELLVGAPGSNQVALYSFTPDLVLRGAPRVFSAPAGAGRFGAALTFGPVAGTRSQLVVGAPGTVVDGVADAGGLYLLDRPDPQFLPLSTLATPEPQRRLGERLGLVPFRRPGEQESRWLLAAGGSQAVYLFFANLVSGHGDVRVH